MEVVNSTFDNNTATSHGGAVYYDYTYPRVLDCHFVNNSAKYEPNFASYPVRVGAVGSDKDDEIRISDVGSGIELSEVLELALIDHEGQVMNLDSENQINIFPQDTSISSIKGTNVVTVSSGVAQFSNLAAIIQPEFRKANFTVTSKAIDYHKVQTVLGASASQALLNLEFRY